MFESFSIVTSTAIDKYAATVEPDIKRKGGRPKGANEARSVPTAVALKPSEALELDALCERAGCTRSEILRNALSLYIHKHGG